MSFEGGGGREQQPFALNTPWLIRITTQMDTLLSGTTLNAKQALKLLPSWSLLETRKKATIIYKQLVIYYVKCYPVICVLYIRKGTN